MREILFRGKRKDNGEWVCGNYGFNDTFTTENHYIFQNKAWEFFVDPATVGQYTGLTDKNGKKIFEGDIIGFYIDGKLVVDGFVEYGQFNCTCCNGVYGWHIVAGDIRWVEDYEVIGNIHDNPELLEVEKCD